MLPILSVMMLLACAAWGQIAPQDQLTMPNPVVRESPATAMEPSLPQPFTRTPMPRPPLDGKYMKKYVEVRKELEEEIKERWREIFGVDPVYGTKEIPHAYPNLLQNGIPVLPSYVRPVGQRQTMPPVEIYLYLLSGGKWLQFDAEPNQYHPRVFGMFVSMVEDGLLRLAGKSSVPYQPLKKINHPLSLSYVKPFSILLDEESQKLFENIPLDKGITEGMPVLPQYVETSQPAQEEPEPEPQPTEQQPRQYFRPYIAFDPDLYHQVQLRRAMRENEALEAEQEAADQEQDEPELPMLERGRFAPWPESLTDMEEASPDQHGASREMQSHAPSEVLFEQGLAAFQARTYHNSMRVFQQAYEAKPNDLEIGFAYGLALFACNRFEQAGEILLKIIAEAELAEMELPAITAFYANERDYRSHRASLERRLALNPGNNALEALVRMLPTQLAVD